MELSPLATSNTALCWNALDYSESQPEASQFAVRFKVRLFMNVTFDFVPKMNI